MLVSDSVAAFLSWTAERRSENTHRFYDGRLKAFVATFGSKKCKKLSLEKVENYFLKVNHWPDGREKAADTQRGNAVAFEQWQKFAVKRGHIKKAIIEDLEKPVGRRRERLPTPEEVEQIKALGSPEFNLIYQALRQSGARPNEICRATVEDWDRTDNVIILKQHKTAAKTGKPRKIFVGGKLLELIQKSLGDRTAGPLFLTPRGKPWTRPNLSQCFSRYRNECGITKEVVLYCTRHEFCTKSCEEQGLEITADLAGHSSINTTRHYVHKKAEQLRANQDVVSL